MQDYLSHYAEPEAREVLSQLKGRWNAVVVLPLLGEAEAMETVSSIETAAGFAGKNPLIVAVVNAKETASLETHEINQSLLTKLRARQNIYVVDRASAGRFFPEDQGVGLARKIGCDIAVALICAGNLDCDFIHTTDGDAIVDKDYFSPPTAPSQGLEKEPPVALWHRYTHELEARQSLPLCLYEISLRYYVLGLRYARSEYAFPTVGSTQGFTAQAYCQVRGFPRREAGEDFYLMNKLAKVGGVAVAPGYVRLKARPSSRVPFGTGAAMRKIAAALENNEPFPLYHPKTFEWLHDWLEELDAYAEHGDLTRLQECLREKQGEPLLLLLKALRAWEALPVAIETRPQITSRRRHLHTWFDAFRTLKFVHGARDRYLGWLPFSEALPLAPFVGPINTSDPYEILDVMRRLEEEN